MSDVIVKAGERSITLRRPNVLSQYRLVEALGDAAENRVYLMMCVPLLYVAAIDDAPVLQPRTKLEIEGIIQCLEEDGLQAVQDGIRDHFQTSATAVESAKKSQGTPA